MTMSGFVFVVGAGGGIGKETCLTFAERGASGIAFADIDEDAARRTAEESRTIATNSEYQTLVLKTDVTIKWQMQAAVDKAVSTFGRIDCFVNSAGIEPQSIQPISHADLDEFDILHTKNTKSMLVGIAVLSEVMKKQKDRFVSGRGGQRSIGRGNIINVISVAALMASPGMVQYIASKYGALGVTKVAANELVDAGVRVNAVLPSWAEGPMMDRVKENFPQLLGPREKLMPLQRMAKMEEIAGTIHFLCSPDASYINGVGLPIDGGSTIGGPK